MVEYIFVIHRNLLLKTPYYKAMTDEEIKYLDMGFPVSSNEHILNYSQRPKILSPIMIENENYIYPGLGVSVSVSEYESLNVSEHESFYRLPPKKYKIKKGKRRKYWKNYNA